MQTEVSSGSEIRRVGVIGGGQLAWMMSGAARSLGIDLFIQTPAATDPAVTIARQTILGAIADGAATTQLAELCDVITFENEFVNLEALQELADRGVCFHPSLSALKPLLDKYHQRCYLKTLQLPVPRFVGLEAETPEISDFGLGYPLVLKTRRHGYDGQGTFIIPDPESLQALWQKLAGQPLILEEFVPFERELAVIAARSQQGEIVTYPIVETQQEQQVCRRVFTLPHLEPEIIRQVNQIAQTLLTHLQVVGVFGIELFLRSDGQVLVNEIAPRTHNSGHFTLDACETSQFEQQLRAVSHRPLGSPALKPGCTGAVMVNLLGYESSRNDYLEKRQRLAAIPQAFVHWYGKSEARPGRKLGHVTVLLQEESTQSPAELAATIESIWYPT